MKSIASESKSIIGFISKAAMAYPNIKGISANDVVKESKTEKSLFEEKNRPIQPDLRIVDSGRAQTRTLDIMPSSDDVRSRSSPTVSYRENHVIRRHAGGTFVINSTCTFICGPTSIIIVVVFRIPPVLRANRIGNRAGNFIPTDQQTIRMVDRGIYFHI